MKAIQVIKLSIGLSLCFVVPSFAVNVTIPDISASPGSTGFKIPIMVGDVTGLGIISYQFTVSFDESVLDATGATTSGTISSSWGVPTVNTSIDDEITVVIYGTSAISGSGVLIYLIFDIPGSPGDSTNLAFDSFLFNEGNPSVSTSGGQFKIKKTTDVTVQKYPTISQHFSVSQNYPNPFNPETTIEYQIPKSAQVTIKIYNLMGQEIATLVNEDKFIGYFKIIWNGKDLYGHQVTSGVYIYQMRAGDFVARRKLILLR